MNEPAVYSNIKESFLRYEFLNKLYNIFGIKIILLVRYALGMYNLFKVFFIIIKVMHINVLLIYLFIYLFIY